MPVQVLAPAQPEPGTCYPATLVTTADHDDRVVPSHSFKFAAALHIGIGASPACDGQILVLEDMLGLNPNPPRFVREYAHLGPEIEAAVKAYASDVRSRHFPSQENVYTMSKGSSAG